MPPAAAPIKDIHSFIGTFTLNTSSASAPPPLIPSESVPLHTMSPTVSPLTAENVLWSNTVLAAGSAVGFVIYTGAETRAVMNTSHPGTKVGLLDLEINKLAKVCSYRLFGSGGDGVDMVIIVPDPVCGDVCALSRPRCAQWVQGAVVHICIPILDSFLVYHPYQARHPMLFIHIECLHANDDKNSLRVNLDMGKTVYAQQIMNDSEIPNTIVRTSTLPEELGRIEYLLSDKTGTLTQNGSS